MDYKGYELFYDIEDKELQAHNRAAVLWNIFENNSKKGKATARGVVDMVGYTKEIPEQERKEVLAKFSDIIAAPSTEQ